MKKVLSLLWMMTILTFAFTSCGDDDNEPKIDNLEKGIHKIAVEISGDTDAYSIICTFGGTTLSGPAKLYDENNDYQGNSYTLTNPSKYTFSCQTSENATFLTSAFTISTTEKGKKLTLKLVAYIDDKKADELTKTVDSGDKEVTVETVSFSTKTL